LRHARGARRRPGDRRGLLRARAARQCGAGARSAGGPAASGVGPVDPGGFQMVGQPVREVEIPDPSLLRRFDVAGPRYTSYPTADRFSEAFDADSYAGWLRSRVVMPPKPLSLYVH